MTTLAVSRDHGAAHPVDLILEPAPGDRNRLTAAFRIFLALPHLLLVGGPIAATLWWSLAADGWDWGFGGGALGAVAGVSALIAWFAIVFTGRHPAGLRELAVFYLRWRVRAVAYTALLRDEYPPFGDAAYPVGLRIAPAEASRDRLTVALRPILALPHLVIVWALGLAWFAATVVAWFSILLNGRYPPALLGLAEGVFRWSTRVEAYLLLLHDEYPPFSLE